MLSPEEDRSEGLREKGREDELGAVDVQRDALVAAEARGRPGELGERAGGGLRI